MKKGTLYAALIIGGFIFLVILMSREQEISDKRSQAAYSQQQKQFDALIKQHKFTVGMTAEQVNKSIGEPRRVNRIVHSNLISEQWIYEWRSGRTHYLYFDNGILRSWQDSK